jgi:anaerobic magnesium-protoporphyrin IX monomethyl ester cyclase
VKIKLINLPQPDSLDDKLDPPLGLMYISAFLEEHNILSEIIDLPFIKRKEWQDKIGRADFYGITVYSASLYLAKEVAKIAKSNNPQAKIVIGGHHPAALGEEALKDEANFDIVVMQEGEITMLELAEGKPFSEIQGIIYRDKNHIYRNKQRALIKDLDMLPMPKREILKKNKYTRKVYGDFATSVITSRGCAYNCAFCCKNIFGSQIRFRSPENVENEIKQIIKDYGIKNFIFYDDTFTLHKKRLYDLCQRLSKLNIIFRCNGDARHNSPEDYIRLYQAGCREIAFGIESASQMILDNINKGVTVEQNRQAIKEAKKAGLLVRAYLMIGSPGETRQTIEETMKFVQETNPDQFTLFNFIPLPGCAIWNDPQKYNIKIVNRNFKDYFNIAGDNQGGLVVETQELSSKDLSNLRQDFVAFLNKKGQSGPLQDYYNK